MASKKQIKSNKWFTISIITFAIIVSGCLCYILLDMNKPHDMVCDIKMVDQITGLVKLNCVR
jgi:hypothetical protein